MSRDRDRERSNERDGGRERKPAPSVDGLYTLKIDNISFKTTADVLRDEFSRYGDLGDVYLPRNYSTNEPRGFAFVRFTNRLDGEDALREMVRKKFTLI
jgi:RNA recognition motif-containing protein